MRRVVPAVFLAALLALAGPLAHAQDGPDPCTAYALQQAMPYLMESYAYTPAGYRGAGYAPLTYPFGVVPAGPQAFFGPPQGAAPAFGPVGPGLTANFIALGVLRPSGFNRFDPASVGTLISLAAQQQLELAQLNLRYSNSAYYQTAAATWAGAYAAEAAAVFNRSKAECQQQQPAAAPSPAPTPAASPAGGY